MAVNVAKESIDLGIVTTQPEKMLAFYCDVLGFKMKGEMQMSGGGRMYRLLFGSSLIKIVVNETDPAASAVPGGIPAATGYRYFTITISNLEESVQACRLAGHKVVVPPREIRSGVVIAFVEDPDGNWVEFLQAD